MCDRRLIACALLVYVAHPK